MSMATMRKLVKSRVFSYLGTDRALNVGCNIQCNVDYVGTAKIKLCFVLSGLGKGHEIPL